MDILFNFIKKIYIPVASKLKLYQEYKMAIYNKNTLKKPRAVFSDELKNRIELGNKLLTRKINTTDELDELYLDFYAWEDINKELIKYAFEQPDNEHFKKYEGLHTYSGFADAFNRNINTNDFQYKLNAQTKKIKGSIRFLNHLSQKLAILPSSNSIAPYSTLTKEYTNKGFIVHGHNNTLKLEVARFIDKQLKKDTVILHEQASKGKTVIEKFESYSTVDFAIALWTNDDLGKAKDNKNLKPRARQNVIFETGFFIGKIGREKVIILHEKDIEIPSDYSGVVYISIEGNWKEQLRTEIDEIYKI
ncbi:TIR domain-containing protein [Winogradskyella sp. MIT101101]|uniref:TIR domain-containing protein n=1 Tax=Winogradskyella sp. MIT101101 TaxID=3098297 RepID=UPI00399A9C8B